MASEIEKPVKVSDIAPAAPKKPAKKKVNPARAAKKSAARNERKSVNPLAKALAALNDGTALEDLKVDLAKLNDFANAHPELPLGGNLRSKLHLYVLSLNEEPSN